MHKSELNHQIQKDILPPSHHDLSNLLENLGRIEGYLLPYNLLQDQRANRWSDIADDPTIFPWGKIGRRFNFTDPYFDDYYGYGSPDIGVRFNPFGRDRGVYGTQNYGFAILPYPYNDYRFNTNRSHLDEDRFAGMIGLQWTKKRRLIRDKVISPIYMFPPANNLPDEDPTGANSLTRFLGDNFRAGDIIIIPSYQRIIPYDMYKDQAEYYTVFQITEEKIAIKLCGSHPLTERDKHKVLNYAQFQGPEQTKVIERPLSAQSVQGFATELMELLDNNNDSDQSPTNQQTLERFLTYRRMVRVQLDKEILEKPENTGVLGFRDYPKDWRQTEEAGILTTPFTPTTVLVFPMEHHLPESPQELENHLKTLPDSMVAIPFFTNNESSAKRYIIFRVFTSVLERKDGTTTPREKYVLQLLPHYQDDPEARKLPDI